MSGDEGVEGADGAAVVVAGAVVVDAGLVVAAGAAVVTFGDVVDVTFGASTSSEGRSILVVVTTVVTAGFSVIAGAVAVVATGDGAVDAAVVISAAFFVVVAGSVVVAGAVEVVVTAISSGCFLSQPIIEAAKIKRKQATQAARINNLLLIRFPFYVKFSCLFVIYVNQIKQILLVVKVSK